MPFCCIFQGQGGGNDAEEKSRRFGNMLSEVQRTMVGREEEEENGPGKTAEDSQGQRAQRTVQGKVHPGLLLMSLSGLAGKARPD